MPVVEVDVSAHPYRILIEEDLLHALAVHVREVCDVDRVLLAVDERIAETHGALAIASLSAAGIEPTVHGLVARESRKTLETVRGIYDTMLAARLPRSCPVIALGGGIVGDVAGFAAATYHRGVPLIQVPTTLLAMVDAAIGGKTGVNHPLPGGDVLGKNLVGAFWQPRIVLSDPQVLVTLDPRHLRCGLAECVKHGVIADPALFAFIEEHADELDADRVPLLTELVTRAVRVKAAIVARDEREAGERALLNLGHTFAHAIEAMRELDLHHGEAVSIGLCLAARCAERTGRLAADDRRRIVALLVRLGLPVRLDHAVPASALLTAMSYDKKVAGGRVRLVLPQRIGSALVTDEVPPDVIEEAWTSAGAAAA